MEKDKFISARSVYNYLTQSSLWGSNVIKKSNAFSKNTLLVGIVVTEIQNALLTSKIKSFGVDIHVKNYSYEYEEIPHDYWNFAMLNTSQFITNERKIDSALKSGIRIGLPNVPNKIYADIVFIPQEIYLAYPKKVRTNRWKLFKNYIKNIKIK